ncbi:dephospho-CoA kinase Cab5p [Trichomonascus vanleenenianus]|uniref:putative dephospho-CoA kinase n=1 Tax=Trichomonascus vanleenenianus TaxID=2268995 RepID=UPI003ECA46B7
MLLLGLTGGIATGKSTVSKHLKKNHGLPIVDADVIARQVVEPGTKGYKRIVEHFGPLCSDLLLEDGSLNRPALGRVVFGNEEERRYLGSIVHPAVRLEMARQVVVAWIKGHRIVVLDVPLLFESKLDRFCGTSVAVVCDEGLELTRLLARDTHLTEEDAKNRINSQMPIDEKAHRADIAIRNDGTLEELYAEVDKMVASVTPGAALSTAEWLCPPFGVFMALITYLYRTVAKPKL